MTINHSQIGVVGAGTMGAGIAQVSVQAGFETVVYDVSQEFIDKGLGRIRGFIQRSRERGKLDREEEERILARLSGSLKLEDLSGACLVIEAAPEKIELKREIFQKLDFVCDPESLLANPGSRSPNGMSFIEVLTLARKEAHVIRSTERGRPDVVPPRRLVLGVVVAGFLRSDIAFEVRA